MRRIESGGDKVEFIREIWRRSGVRVWWEGGVEVGSVFGPPFLVKGRTGVKICLVWEREAVSKEKELDLGVTLEWGAHPLWKRAKAKCSLTFNTF